MPGDGMATLIQTQKTIFIHTNTLKKVHKFIVLIAFLFLEEKNGFPVAYCMIQISNVINDGLKLLNFNLLI